MAERIYSIKTATRSEVEIAVEWAAEEGWNPGVDDAESYYAADPTGFLVGLMGDEPVATISAVKYGDTFGFIGLYIVKPAYRGKGYGWAIWRAALEHLEGRSIGLDGVVAQQENYRASGFEFAYNNIRYQGVGGGKAPDDIDIVKLSTLPFESVDAYDRPFFPARRSEFIAKWIGQPHCHALGVRQRGELAGYGVIRTCRAGHKMGPLFADSPDLAESLFLALKAEVKASDLIFLDTPQVNQAAVDMALRHGMEVSFETARMYRGKIPNLPVDRTFGVTSFELG